FIYYILCMNIIYRLNKYSKLLPLIRFMKYMKRKGDKMKKASDIVKYGVVKKYGVKKKYAFNSIDIETVNNEMFLLGYYLNDVYYCYLNKLVETINNLIIRSVQNNRDILTWSRYDNHFILKNILMSTLNINEINEVLKKIGKFAPIHRYNYNGYKITVIDVIKDSLIFDISYEKSKKRVHIYNLKNLFNNDLLTIAKNYKLDYYSKLGEEYHIIDKQRFFNDENYKELVIKSNQLDSRVIIRSEERRVGKSVDIRGSRNRIKKKNKR